MKNHFAWVLLFGGAPKFFNISYLTFLSTHYLSNGLVKIEKSKVHEIPKGLQKKFSFFFIGEGVIISFFLNPTRYQTLNFFHKNLKI
jgi:hypothetical protein